MKYTAFKNLIGGKKQQAAYLILGLLATVSFDGYFLKLSLAEAELASASVFHHYANYRQEMQILTWSLATMPEDNPRYPVLLNQYGLLQRCLGNYSSAESSYRKCIELSHSRGCENDAFVDTYQNNLALALEEQGKTQEAEELYKAVIRKRQSMPHSLATTYSNLACLYRHQGKLAQAAHLWQTSIDLASEASADKSHLASFTSNLACVKNDLGDNSEAKLLEAKARKLAESPFVEESTKSQLMLNEAICMWNQGIDRSNIARLTSTIAKNDRVNYPDGCPLARERALLIQTLTQKQVKSTI